jgi:hypothetical protein
MKSVNYKHVYHYHQHDLAHCKICNGAEGSLPTDCPGVKMTSEEEDAVYDGKINFISGEWTNKINDQTLNSKMRIKKEIKYMPPTKEYLLERIKLLGQEMNNNEQENRLMGDEIEQLYKKIDAMSVVT